MRIVYQNAWVHNRPGEVLCVLVDGEVIIDIAPQIQAKEARAIDCKGLLLCPGFVDVHVHLREPGLSHKETILTGTRAAQAGGYQAVCAMPNVSPEPDSMETLDKQLEIIRRDAQVAVYPYGAITRGQQGNALADIEAMAPHCIGFSDDGRGVQSDDMMEAAMRRVRETGRFIAAHCEDERYAATDSRSEWVQLARDIELVRRTGVRYHACHLSAKESVALIRQAKAEGLPVTCEVTPHQIMLCNEDVLEDDGRFKMNPPLRSREDQRALIDGLLDGTIDVIATDHAPHTAQEKAGGFAKALNGVVGLETAFAVCYTALVETGRTSMDFLLDKMIDAPACLIGKRYAMESGAPATFNIIDPKKKWIVEPERFESKGRATPFAARELVSKIVGQCRKGVHVTL